jgi:hypothetical protein
VLGRRRTRLAGVLEAGQHQQPDSDSKPGSHRDTEDQYDCEEKLHNTHVPIEPPAQRYDPPLSNISAHAYVKHSRAMNAVMGECP